MINKEMMALATVIRIIRTHQHTVGLYLQARFLAQLR